MNIIIERLVVKSIISFVLAEIAKVQKDVKWDELRVKAENHVRDLVPGTWFDDAAVKLVDDVFGSLKLVLMQKDHIASIIQLIADHNYAEAFEKVKELLASSMGHLVVSSKEIPLANLV